MYNCRFRTKSHRRAQAACLTAGREAYVTKIGRRIRRKMIARYVSIIIFMISQGVAYGGSTMMIPMRDGVHLATEVFLPPDTASGPVPVVLNRTPYGRGGSGALQDSLFAHGIGFVSQDTRGRGGSEGVDSLFFDNGWGQKQDGYDTIEWLAAQAWCDGKVGIYGGSAHGITSYLAAGALPPHLVCGGVAHCASNMYEHGAYPGGCYRQEQIDSWYFLMGLLHMKNLIVEHYVCDSTWDRLNVENRFSLINVPFFHAAGWYDTFCEGNMDAFVGLQNGGGTGAQGNQKLVIGPWCHAGWNKREQGDLTYPENSLWDIVPTASRWYAHYLKGENNGIDTTSPVSCYIMGDCDDTTAYGNDWVEFDSWPPADVDYQALFLHPDQTLGFDRPTAVDTGLSYSHDFSEPMLHNGGRNLVTRPGPRDQANPSYCPDLDTTRGKIWTSDVLTEPITIAGKVTARIHASSNCIDTDFMVRLCDVYPSGISYLVLDGALCTRFREGTDHEVFMTPGDVYELEIDLGNTAIWFGVGHRIRVGVSSALYPRYAANPNTGEPFRQHTHTEIAHNTVWTDNGHASHIVLPVIYGFAVDETELAARYGGLSVSPNPFSVQCAISASQFATVEVFDMAGRRVEQLPGGRSAWSPARTIPSGLYFVRARTGERTVTRKVLYLK